MRNFSVSQVFRRFFFRKPKFRLELWVWKPTKYTVWPVNLCYCKLLLILNLLRLYNFNCYDNPIYGLCSHFLVEGKEKRISCNARSLVKTPRRRKQSWEEKTTSPVFPNYFITANNIKPLNNNSSKVLPKL